MVVKKRYLVIMILLLFTGITATTYAYFSVSVTGGPAGSSGVTTGVLELAVSDSAVSVNDLKPMYNDYYKYSYSKTFTLTNESSTLNGCSKIALDISAISSGLASQYFKYSLESDDYYSEGNFSGANTTDDKILLENIFVESGESVSFTLYLWIGYDADVNQVDMLGTSFAATVKSIATDTEFESSCIVTPWDQVCNASSTSLQCKIISANTAISDSSLDFGAISSASNGQGLYYTANLNKTEDENSDEIGEKVFYYRGAVTNNYVIFADYCWKIVRTIEGGGVKLFYWGVPTNGTCSTTPAPVASTYVYNSDYAYNAHEGYMIGTPNSDNYADEHQNLTSSGIKSYLDSWYLANIVGAEGTVSSLIKNAKYCNDRSPSPQATFGGGSHTGLAYGANKTLYGAFGRVVSTSGWSGTGATPQYLCPNNNDKFTLKTENGGVDGYGNNALVYPVGLLTIDEESYAGSVAWTTNNTYFLFTETNYWLMSPSYYSGQALQTVINSNGGINDRPSNNGANIHPVISLKSSARVVDNNGNGTAATPYLVNIY